MQSKIKELKAEIFDIIREQERLQQAFNHLQQIKIQKVKELEVLEKESKGEG